MRFIRLIKKGSIWFKEKAKKIRQGFTGVNALIIKDLIASWWGRVSFWFKVYLSITIVLIMGVNFFHWWSATTEVPFFIVKILFFIAGFEYIYLTSFILLLLTCICAYHSQKILRSKLFFWIPVVLELLTAGLVFKFFSFGLLVLFYNILHVYLPNIFNYSPDLILVLVGFVAGTVFSVLHFQFWVKLNSRPERNVRKINEGETEACNSGSDCNDIEKEGMDSPKPLEHDVDKETQIDIRKVSKREKEGVKRE